MKNLFTLLFVFFLCSGKAATYYISSVSGDDSYSVIQARSASTPWKTLSKLNSYFSSLQPGDQVLLKRGETFYGTITVKKSGTSGSPIVIGAYGSGNKPLITSLITVNKWVSKGNGIWESYNASLGATVNNVLLNGAVQQIGRYPNRDAANKGYLVIEAYTQKSITDNQLKSSPDWTGAELVLRSRRWIIDRCPITKHSGHTITYIPASDYDANVGYGYFIQNDIKTLDQFGEWYYNRSSKKLSLYFGSNNPSSYNIQATTIDNLISASNYSNIVFDNLNVKGANADGINIRNGSNINIKNCDIAFSGGNGITAKFHTNIKVENSTIVNSNDNGINLGYSGDNAIIRNNKVTNTSVFAGMGGSGDGKSFAIQSNGNNSVIEHNEIINTGYVGINFNGDNTLIKNNYIDGFCLTKDDGSGIYTFTGSSNATRTGRKVIDNIVINGIGAPEGINSSNSLAEGIYLDDNASGVEISGNTVANVPSKGIFLHNARNVIVKNNTVFNTGVQLHIIHDTKGSAVRKCVITNNIFFLKTASQKGIVFSSIANDFNSLGRVDSNYYARPSDDQSGSFLKKVHVYEPKANVNNYTKPLRFEFNSSTENKTVALGSNYSDVKNNKYSNSIVLQPFTSKVLIQTSGETDTPPKVSITSPSTSTSYTSPAAIKISADASDDKSVSKVEFYNGTTLLNTQSSAPYIYSWSNVSAGNYTLTAKATDNNGNVTTSESVTISVSAGKSSTISLTSPAQNASYHSDATINLSADVNVVGGSVSKVEFYNGTALLQTETESPYSWNWQNVSNGNYTLTAKVTDNDGNVTTSESVTISVSEQNLPVVSLTSPVQDSSYASGATISMGADASETGGVIKKVEFYNGNTLLHTETEIPYTFNWLNVSTGTYTITAKAYDDNGNVTTSEGIVISVSPNDSFTVSLTSPAQDATYGEDATIYISADASVSSGSIKRVEFYNGTNLLHTETGSPYEWNWRKVPAGNYIITAKAVDNNGNEMTSESVTISVLSDRSATVSLTSPAQDTSYDSGAVINISAEASVSKGWISKVEFYDDATLIHTETGSPYTWNWKDVQAGEHTLTAKVIDNNGNETTSESVTILVAANMASRSITKNSSVAKQEVTYTMKVLPNPAVNTIKINLKKSELSNQKADLSIRNVSGIQLKNVPFIVTGNTIEADVSSLKTGVYIVTIVNGNFKISKKFIKN